MEGTPALILAQMSGKSDLMNPNSSTHQDAHYLLGHLVLVSKTYLISSMCAIAELIIPVGQNPSWNRVTNGRILFLWGHSLKDSCAKLSGNFSSNTCMNRMWHME